MTPEDFIRANTVAAPPPLVPEIDLYLASELVPLWHRTEIELAQIGIPPPYWAFAWAGGQALARYVLDHPTAVAGKRVLDIGAGSGLVAIAAAKAGAATVLAAEIDAFAAAAIRLNAAHNDVPIEVLAADLIGGPLAWDIILVGDLFYERALADRLLAWLRDVEIPVYVGDPGRNYFPKTGARRIATYAVETTHELEDRAIRHTGVYRLFR